MKSNDFNFDFSKLRGKIVEKFKTQEEFAKAMGCSTQTLNYKLNNKIEFTSREINKAIKLLDIKNQNEAWQIFFTKKVEKKSTD